MVALELDTNWAVGRDVIFKAPQSEDPMQQAGDFMATQQLVRQGKNRRDDRDRGTSGRVTNGGCMASSLVRSRTRMMVDTETAVCQHGTEN